MSIIKWKEHKVISIEIKKGLFALAQMIKEPYIIFFNLFNQNNKWNEVKLESQSILFCHAVTRQFLKSTHVIEQKSVRPLGNYTPPFFWIHATGAKKIKTKLNTNQEREILVLAEKKTLIEKDVLKPENNKHESGLYIKIIKELNNEDDTESYELTTIEVYPNLNERLFLCHTLGKMVDPAKEIIFEKPIPIEYGTYVDILSGNVPLSSIGY